MEKQIISKAIGIDLGTTNSAVAVMDPTDTKIIIHTDPVAKRKTTPSCVWKNPKTKEIVVGHKAFQRVGMPSSPIRSVKRKMGQQASLKLDQEDVTPVEVSAYILKEMKRQIEEDIEQFSTDTTQWIVDRAIITVPAYFDQPQIDATRKAGELAGLQVLELLHEPTASACHYCWEKNIQNGVFLVYDLGGGTFDVTVLRCTEGAFEVLGISGNTWLGGDNMDDVLAEEILNRLFEDDYLLELDVKNNPEDRLRFDKLKFLAEGVKKGLSTSGDFMLRDTGSLQDQEGKQVIIETEFDRLEVESLIRSLVEKTIPYCFDALDQAEKKAGIKLADVDAIILAGGPSHIPLVREIVRQNLCSPFSESVVDERARQPRAKCEEPVYEKVDTIVALGSAIRASAIGGLTVYNPEKTVRVSFRGTGVSDTKDTYVGGKVEVLGSDIDLTGGHIKLIIPDLEFEDEDDLKEGGTFSLRRIPLQQSANNLLAFEVYDNTGKLITTASRHITQDGSAGPTGGGTSTAVLPKSIALEVRREGKPVLEELIPELATLPANKDFTFYHPGGTEFVLLSLYQKNKKIQVIKVEVPSSLPKGTPINLNINIDELSLITIKGNIGDTVFDALIEPPPDRKIPTNEEIESLEQKFREAIGYLAPGKQSVAEARYNKAKQSFEEAVKRGDKEQAVNDFEEMENLVADISKPEDLLKPPKDFFDELVQECFNSNMEVAELANKKAYPYDQQEIAKSIETQRNEGERAWAAEDQKAYSEVNIQLESIHNHITSIGRNILSKEGGDKETDVEKAINNIKYIEQLASKLAKHAEGQNREDLQNEIEEIKNRLKQLANEVQKDPQGVLNEVAEIYARLERINNILMGKKELEPLPFPEDLK